MNNYPLLDLSEIYIIDKIDEFNKNIELCINNKLDARLLNSLKYIDNNLNTIPKKKKIKNSRLRQLKINEASKRTREKKKIHVKIMSNHIKKLHELINKYNITNLEIIDEVCNFDKTILID